MKSTKNLQVYCNLFGAIKMNRRRSIYSPLKHNGFKNTSKGSQFCDNNPSLLCHVFVYIRNSFGEPLSLFCEVFTTS